MQWLQRVLFKNNFFDIMTFLLKLSSLIKKKFVIVWTILKKYLFLKKLFSFYSFYYRGYVRNDYKNSFTKFFN